MSNRLKDIVIYGAGGFGKEVACLINHINENIPTWNLIGFIDDSKPKGTMVSHFGRVLGNIDILNEYTQPLNVVIAIGSGKISSHIVSKITNQKIEFPNIIHPNITINDIETFQLGYGNIIQGNCTISCNVTIGCFNILNGSVVIGHDSQIGNFNTIMPATRISGEVKIGNNNFLGVASIVLQQLKIGNNVTIGAGAVLMTKPKENCTYIGNPAKLFKY